MEKVMLNLNRPTNVKELLNCFANGEPVVVNCSARGALYGRITLIVREDDSGLSFCLHMSEYDVLGEDTGNYIEDVCVRFEE